jgi:hypothetical protein|tara:strand:- start:458 stop:811 length:354 start_codon:yes stop_codon:yes gene_type:complete
MSMNLTGRLIEFSVKSGATSTLIMNVTTSSGTAKNMSSTSTYATAKWKVWQPDGTLIINGTATFSDRLNGQISYALTSANTAITNAGVWEGEIEFLNSSNVISDQSETFNFTIEESY